MKIDYQVCEPEDLFWVGSNKTRSIIRVVDSNGYNGSVYNLTATPEESVIKEMMLEAKDKSKLTKQDSLLMIREGFILQDRITIASGATKTFLVARYENGELEEYCRPAWRKGFEVNCRLF